MPSFEIPLDLPHVELIEAKRLDDGAFLLRLQVTKKRAKCPYCNRYTDKIHAYDDAIRLRHMDVLGHPCYLELKPQRFLCERCKGKDKRVFTQRLSWYKPKSRMTKAYEAWILCQLVNSTFVDVARKTGNSPLVIERLLKTRVADEPDWSGVEEIGVLGLDEIALKKGRRQFVTIVSGRKAGRVRVLAVLEDRKKTTVSDFLAKIPEQLKATIEAVCTDMYEGFTSAVAEQLPGVRHVIDRFHVAKLLGESVDKLRKSELSRLRKELSEEEYKELKGSLWPCRRLGIEEGKSEALDAFLEHSPKLREARELREELTQTFDKVGSEHGGRSALGRWIKKVERSGLACFESFLGTLDKWWEGICAYFVAGESGGFVEGLNNRIKAAKRRCYGLGSAKALYQRLKLDLEGYELFGEALPNM